MSAFDLIPAVVPEWVAEDELLDVLGDEIQDAQGDDVFALLDAVTVSLPDQLYVRPLELTQPEVLGPELSVAPDLARFRYALLEAPLGVLVPTPKRLHRLRLSLSFDGGEQSPSAFNVFPPDQWTYRDILQGEVHLDVSKALSFVCPPLATATSEAFGLKLKMPFGWKQTDALVQTTGPMSNPLHWLVRDEQIAGAFTGYVILQIPRPSPSFTVRATLIGEIRRGGIAGAPIVRMFFRSNPKHDQHEYVVANYEK